MFTKWTTLVRVYTLFPLITTPVMSSQTDMFLQRVHVCLWYIIKKVITNLPLRVPSPLPTHKTKCTGMQVYVIICSSWAHDVPIIFVLRADISSKVIRELGSP